MLNHARKLFKFFLKSLSTPEMSTRKVLTILTSFHPHGRLELGARDHEHDTDDEPFFTRASDQTHRPSNPTGPASKTDEHYSPSAQSTDCTSLTQRSFPDTYALP